jgi:hypothetical protein
MKCKRRFYARKVAFAFMRNAHCPRCGNLELQRISREWVNSGWLRWPFWFIGVPAYRCDPCRLRFFSFRSPYQASAGETESITTQPHIR